MVIETASYAVISIYRQEAREDGGNAYLQKHWDGKRLKTPIKWFAVWNSGQFVGCIGLLAKGRTATIRGWFVRKQYRGQGYGRKLLDHAVAQAWRQGFDKVDVTTRVSLDEHDWKPVRRFKKEGTKYERVSPQLWRRQKRESVYG